MNEINLATYQPSDAPLPIMDFQVLAEQAAFFRQNASHRTQRELIASRLREEMTELLGPPGVKPAVVDAILWGHQNLDASLEDVRHNMVDEGGDCLYLITAGGMLFRQPLLRLLEQGLSRVLKPAKTSALETFADFDRHTVGLMPEETPSDFIPQYFTLQFWGVPPFEASKNGYTITVDARYTLAYTLRECTELIATAPQDPQSDPSLSEEFATIAGDALLALSAVAQKRLGASLEQMARLNIAKIQRRYASGTQEEGADPGRSRGAGITRPSLTGWQATQQCLGITLQR